MLDGWLLGQPVNKLGCHGAECSISMHGSRPTCVPAGLTAYMPHSHTTSRQAAKRAGRKVQTTSCTVNCNTTFLPSTHAGHAASYPMAKSAAQMAKVFASHLGR